MKFTMEMNIDNASFEDDPEYEFQTIFKDIELRILGYEKSGIIKDFNGNTIGQWEIKEAI
jgi:hypothetical protein